MGNSVMASAVTLLAIFAFVNSECLLHMCGVHHHDAPLKCTFAPTVDYPPTCEDEGPLQTVVLQCPPNAQLPILTAQHLGHLKVRSLALRQLNIRQVHHDVFEFTADVLEKLDLSENLLTSLPPHLFQQCENLTSINLSLNRFTDLPTSVFLDVTQLTDLNLAGNRIESLRDDDFLYLTHLVNMDLSFNKLHQLAPTNLPLQRLKFLALTGNHLDCDCHLAWLRDMVPCLCVFQYDNCDFNEHGTVSLVDFPLDRCVPRDDRHGTLCDDRLCNDDFITTDVHNKPVDMGVFHDSEFGD